MTPPLTTTRRRLGPGGRKYKRPSKAELRRLRDLREDLGITEQMVADEAAKTARFGTCHRATVAKALWKGDSRNVLDALRRLIAAVA